MRPLALIAAVALLAVLWIALDPGLDPAMVPLDADGSGAIDEREAGPVVRRAFAVVDADGDGALDGAELRRWMLRRWLTGGARPLAPLSGEAGALPYVLDEVVASGGLDGVGLVVLVDGQPVLRHVSGTLSSSTPVPLAEAGLWPASTIFACLDARGELALDEPLAARWPQVPEAFAELTSAQLLSRTAPLRTRGSPSPQDATSLRAAARIVGDTAVAAEAALRSDTAGVAVAARAAEIASGRPWRRLSVECLQWPLSMDDAGWGLRALPPEAGSGVQVPEGFWASLDDLTAFLTLLQQTGRYGGVRTLPRRLLDRLARDDSAGRPRLEVPAGVDARWGHAPGARCEEVDGDRCVVRSVHGAWGTHLWLDQASGVAGALVLVDDRERSGAWVRSVRDLAERRYGRVTSGSSGRPAGGS